MRRDERREYALQLHAKTFSSSFDIWPSFLEILSSPLPLVVFEQKRDILLATQRKDAPSLARTERKIV